MTKFSDEPMSPLVRKLELPEGKILDAIVADDMVLYYNLDRRTRALLLTRGSFAITYEMTKSDVSKLAAALGMQD